MHFDYDEVAASGIPVREDLVTANRRAWIDLAAPGAWWTGAERVAIAEETRRAAVCAYCRERKVALSPNALGDPADRHEHAPGTVLSPTIVDAVHRVATDSGRLTESFVAQLAQDGVSDGHYIELVGIVSNMLSIDCFHFGIGAPLESLPIAVEGEPTRERPDGLEEGIAWLPMLDAKGGSEPDLYSDLPRAPHVLRALSLVPNAVRRLRDLSDAYYVSSMLVANPAANGDRALSRAQIELVAARVSSLNECFY